MDDGLLIHQLTHPRYQDTTGQVHMAWEDVRAWLQYPNLDIGSHTLSHPNLPSLPAEESFQEIELSRKILRAETGCEVEFFAYPNGHYGAREVQFCREAGYRGCLTINPGRFTNGRDLLEIPRTEINFKDTELALRNKLLGGFDLHHKYLHWRRKREFAANNK